MAGIIGSGCAPGLLSRRRPNIVLVTIDTQRYDRLGFNGYERNTSPYLDRIAENGVVFDGNFSQAPYTLPSIASLLTSRYPRDIGMTYIWSNIRPSAKLLPEILKSEGYQTFGAVSMPLLNSRRRFDRGFDFFSFPFTDASAPKKPNANKRKGDETAEILADLLKNNASNRKPVFCWYHSFDPHAPYIASSRFRLKYKTEGSFDDHRRICHLISMVENGILERSPKRMFTEKQIVEFSDRYDGEVPFTDSNIQHLMEVMIEKKLFDFDRDLFVLTADHGELLGEHKYFASHHGAYEEVIHVPLMMAGAGLPKGKRIGAITRNLDVIPTIAEIVDIKPHAVWKGQSLTGNIQGDKERADRPVFVDMTGGEGFAVRERNFKLIKRQEQPVLGHEVATEGFSPTGPVSYNDEQRSFLLSWKPEWAEGGEDLSVNVTIAAMLGRHYRFEIFKLDSPYVPAIDVFSVIQFFGEDKWNASCAKYDTFVWRVKVVRKRGEDSEVVFDSGDLEFQPLPTSRFHELYDMENDPGEAVNLFGKDSHKDIRNQLDTKLAKFQGRHIDVKQPELMEGEKDTLKALGYL